LDWLLINASNFDFCFFIDDDVILDEDYLGSLAELLVMSEAIGASGLALGENETFARNSFLTRVLGISGQPGSLTKAAINVPVREGKFPVNVDWLIGCSVWKYQSIKQIRFQKDFVGQSIFEDVLFSVEASKYGSLLVDPRIRFRHSLEEAGRPNRGEFFAQWVRNRYRLKKIDSERFSLFRFLFANLAFAVKALFWDRDLLALLGIFRGHLSLVRRS